jgi:hypothetical protein
MLKQPHPDREQVLFKLPGFCTGEKVIWFEPGLDDT